MYSIYSVSHNGMLYKNNYLMYSDLLPVIHSMTDRSILRLHALIDRHISHQSKVCSIYLLTSDIYKNTNNSEICGNNS